MGISSETVVNREHYDLTILSDEDVHLIQQYTDEWFDLAVELGFVKWPYAIDDATIASIHACYRKKLLPKDALHFCNRVQNESALFDDQLKLG